MNFREKGYFAKSSLLLGAGYFVTFIVYYLANYIIAADGFSYFYLFSCSTLPFSKSASAFSSVGDPSSSAGIGIFAE